MNPTRRRDVPSFNVQLVGLGRRRFATSRGSKSGRTHQHSRSYLGPAIKRWTSEKYQCSGAPHGRLLLIGWPGAIPAAGSLRDSVCADASNTRPRLSLVEPHLTRLGTVLLSERRIAPVAVGLIRISHRDDCLTRRSGTRTTAALALKRPRSLKSRRRTGVRLRCRR